MEVLDPKVFTSEYIPLWAMGYYEIRDWFFRQDWFDNLKHIRQEPKYHGEGDVLIHTRMVTDELFLLEEFQQLSDWDKKIISISACIHDIGKLLTTTEDKKGIHSYKHPLYGMKITQYLLLFSDIPLNARYVIAKLVWFHDSFIKWEKIKKLDMFLVRMSWNTPMNLLLLLSEADNRGRIASDRDDVLDGITMLREEVIELGCFTRPYCLKNTLARVLLGKKRLPYLDYVPYPFEVERHSHVMMLSGFPGSGKTHFRTEYIKGLYQDWNTYDDLVVVCMDDIRKEFGVRPGDWKAEQKVGVSNIARERFRKALGEHKPIILDNLNLSKRVRSKWLDLAFQYHATTDIVYIEPPIQQVYHQNKNRDDPVPESVMVEKMRYNLEYPFPLEANIVQYFDGQKLFSPY